MAHNPAILFQIKIEASFGRATFADLVSINLNREG